MYDYDRSVVQGIVDFVWNWLNKKKSNYDKLKYDLPGKYKYRTQFSHAAGKKLGNSKIKITIGKTLKNMKYCLNTLIKPWILVQEKGGNPEVHGINLFINNSWLKFLLPKQYPTKSHKNIYGHEFNWIESSCIQMFVNMSFRQ